MDRFGRVFGFLVSFPGVFCWYFPNEKTAVWSTNGVSMLDSILLFSSGHCVADIWLFSDNRNIWFVASLAFHYVSLNLFFFFFFNDYQTRKSCSKLLFRESVRFRSYFLSILPLVSMAINWDSRSSGDGHFSLFFLFFFFGLQHFAELFNVRSQLFRLLRQQILRQKANSAPLSTNGHAKNVN